MSNFSFLFSIGTQWLVSEHKKCLDELEHLKGLLGDLHHWIDVIHERGQSLFGAFNELKKHLGDMQRQMQDMHKQSHSYQVSIYLCTGCAICFRPRRSCMTGSPT